MPMVTIIAIIVDGDVIPHINYCYDYDLHDNNCHIQSTVSL